MGSLATWLDNAVARVEEGVMVKVTPRQLLDAVGARRRGVNVVRDIQARMARRDLTTEPDFALVPLDQEVTLIHDGFLPLHLDQLKKARERIDEGSSPMTVTVRELLLWFGAERRGTRVVDEIESTLWGYELTTEPDFSSTPLDATIAITSLYEDEESTEAAAAEALPPPERRDRTNFLVGALAEARSGNVVSVHPQATLAKAASIMMTHGVSYLPVIHGDRDARGVVRWKEVAEHLAVGRGSPEDAVEDVMAKPVVVRTDDPLLQAIPAILQHGCVLVRDEQNLIAGIVTKTNLGTRLTDFSRPFVLLERVETRIRSLLERGGFIPDELRQLARDDGDPRPVTNVDDLTLGEYKRLLERDDAWARLDIGIEKKPFIERLGKVRLVRNRVMHFNPDSPTPDDVDTLERFVELLEELARVARPPQT